MDLALRDEDVELIAAFDALLAKKSSPTQVRDAEDLGFDPELWAALVGAGVPAMAIGNDAADLRQLALLAELAGRHLVSAPLVESLVVARLLALCSGTEAAALLDRVTEGTIGTVVLHPTGDDTLKLVPAGAFAELLIRYDGADLVAFEAAAPGVPAPNLGSLPIADRTVSGASAVVLATGDQAAAVHAAAVRDWKVLTAAQLTGIGARSLEMGVDYVKGRTIFDQPVGAFQTVAHRLADHVTDLDGAKLLVTEAAWAADRGTEESGALATMALAFAAERGLAVAGDSLHYHGGYGFTLEYDIQLYYRRARALPLVLGSAFATWACLAEQLFDGDPSVLPGGAETTGGADFALGAEVEAFRSEVASFLDQHLTPAVRERVRTTGSMHDWDLHRALGAKGWIAASWPVEYGGQGRTPLEMMAMREEMKKRHAPTEGLGMTLLVARAIRDFASDTLRDDIIPRALRGEILMCLGYSEPQGGSDVASARTRAVRDGDDWLINGQKVFTTLAEEADYVFLLARTNPDVAKHKGLTMFLVPMDAPGVQVDAIRTLGGERTNQTFYADVRIPDSLRVGEVDGGWDVILAALAYERSGVGEDARLFRKLVATVRSAGTIDQPAVREQLARLAAEVEVMKLLGRRSCWVESTGKVPFIEGSMYKLFSAESKLRFSSVILDVLGPEGLRELADPKSPGGGDFVEEFRHAVILPIYGGASEVQRKILAERHLGLPRSV